MAVNILQINVGRSGAATDLAFATAAARGSEVIAVSEFNKRAARGDRWFVDCTGDAAIARAGSAFPITATGSGRGFVWVRIAGVTVYSCYVSPNIPLQLYTDFLRDLDADVAAKTGAIVVCGDFNAKSPEWGSAFEDTRGEALSAWIASRQMAVANDGRIPTFARGESRSFIDLTIAKGSVKGWEVLEGLESLSLHRYIAFAVEVGDSRPPRRYTHGPTNRDQFSARLRDTLAREFNYEDPEAYVRAVADAYRHATPRIRTNAEGKLPYWWSEDIQLLRGKALAARRDATRRAGGRRGSPDAARDAYREARRELRYAINRSKREKWRALLDAVDEDVWGDGFRIVTKGMKMPFPKTSLEPEERRRVIAELFPRHPTHNWARQAVDEIPEFDVGELEAALRRMRSGRAPGPDGIPMEVIRMAAEACGEALLAVLNGQLRGGDFPRIWKRARVVAIEKPRKTPDDPPAYRPICLLDAAGKLYERLLVNRLEAELEEKAPLSRFQFGFRRGRSALQAVKMVTDAAIRAGRAGRLCSLIALDVQNAFNTARWDVILRELRTRGVSAYLTNVVSDYLTEREIRDTARGAGTAVTAGVPQGSVLGPLLWNVMYDGVFGVELPAETALTGYADDLALTVVGDTVEEIKRRGDSALKLVQEWMRERGLVLAARKTEAVLLCGFRRPGPVTFELDGHGIEPGNAVKYLGVTIDRRLGYGEHVRRVTRKAEASLAALSRLMPNVGGPGAGSRKIYASVVNSVILYGAPIWRGALDIARYRNMVARVQRKAALRIARAYRTVSWEAACVIAGVIPIDLLARERTIKGEEEEEEDKDTRRRRREDTMAAWQTEWSGGTKGEWTRRLIPDLRPWVARKHGDLRYQLTQALSGHGSFGTYTLKIGKSPTDSCCYCPGVRDTPEHTLFTCERWAAPRRRAETEVGETLTPENITTLMLGSEERWRSIDRTVVQIMKNKEAEERVRQGGG